MGTQNKELLEKEIESMFEIFDDVEYDLDDVEERKAASEQLKMLYTLKIEEDKIRLENEEKKKDRWFKAGIAAFELLATLTFYGVWMYKGLKFEETGSLTSPTFRGLYSRFKPTK